jgi:hypothetical protein
VAFTTAFASQTPTGTVGNTTLDVTQIPSHKHTLSGNFCNDGGAPDGGGPINFMRDAGNAGTYSDTDDCENTGGGLSHTHTFTGNAINFAVAYADVIIAIRD